MFRFALSYILACFLMITGSFAADPLRRLPEPVQAFAQQFEKDCAANGLGRLVTNDNYDGRRNKPLDVNDDGVPDYVVYKCMFGCSGNPLAFEGRGTPCPWGSLLLSQPEGHKAVFLPGMVTQVLQGMPLRLAITRPRALRLLGNYCEDGYGDHDPQYVYELKGLKLIEKGMCPLGSCGPLLGQFGSAAGP